ncbi:MAG: hypothetical protein NPIRA01_15070 [Nitrospirales bacterium]|nr:MAG: hypothetical protein NPIRA01_15070 [Nitrospirales bacterium]
MLNMNVQENHLIPADLEIPSLPTLALFAEGTFQPFTLNIVSCAALVDVVQMETVWFRYNWPDWKKEGTLGTVRTWETYASTKSMTIRPLKSRYAFKYRNA